MATPYMPRPDAKALTWMRTFAGGLADDPARYMTSPAEANHLLAVVEQFGTALGLTNDPATKTRVTVSAKDEARNAAEQLCRHFYSMIKPNRGISDPEKIAIGVRPMNPARQKIKCPPTSPWLQILAATPHSHTLGFVDSFGGNSRSKPFGATQLQLFVSIGEKRTRSVSEAKLCGVYTKNPINVSFESSDDGKIATYFGRWVSQRGETGKWSLPTSMRIAA